MTDVVDFCKYCNNPVDSSEQDVIMISAIGPGLDFLTYFFFHRDCWNEACGNEYEIKKCKFKKSQWKNYWLPYYNGDDAEDDD